MAKIFLICSFKRNVLETKRFQHVTTSLEWKSMRNVFGLQILLCIHISSCTRCIRCVMTWKRILLFCLLVTLSAMSPYFPGLLLDYVNVNTMYSGIIKAKVITSLWGLALKLINNAGEVLGSLSLQYMCQCSILCVTEFMLVRHLI